MKNKRIHNESGVSIVEILLVVVIAMILAAAAVVSFGRAKQSLERENIVREFKANLERARSDSVRRRASTWADMAKVVIINSRSYSLNADFDYSGALEAGETRTFSILNGKAELVSNGLNFPVTVAFDWRGQIEVEDVNGNQINPQFTFCNAGCLKSNGSFDINSYNSSVVFLSRAGEIGFVNGTYNQTANPTPSISTVAASQDIRDLARISTGNGYNSNTNQNPTPTPTATPRPTATPSPTATPTPTPQPTPTATPTPTPTPTPSPTPTPCVKKNGKPC